MNLTIGTVIEFSEAVFGGSYRRPTHLGTRTIAGTIVKESYGERRGQHTFTIEVTSATGYAADDVLQRGKIYRKGRNVYRDCRVISTPENQAELAAEKAERAAEAKGRKYLNWISDAEDDPWVFAEKLDRIPDAWLNANPDAARRVEFILGGA